MTEENRASIIFDEKEYFVDELNDKELHYVNQIKTIQKKLIETRAEYEQLEVASNGFTELLGVELGKRDTEFVAE